MNVTLMPQFPQLVIRMDEAPAQTARRWNRQFAKFRKSWDAWTRGMADVERFDPALSTRAQLALIEALLATLAHTQLLLIKALEDE